MYEELVKELRDCRNKAVISEYWWQITTTAADAMDEMNRCLDGIEADNESLSKRIENLSKTIVRCRDCKHNGAHCPIQAAGFSVYAGSDIKPEKPFGCMYGERKEKTE